MNEKKVFVNTYSDDDHVSSSDGDVYTVAEFNAGDGSPKGVVLYAKKDNRDPFFEIVLSDAVCREVVRTWAMIGVATKAVQ